MGTYLTRYIKKERGDEVSIVSEITMKKDIKVLI